MRISFIKVIFIIIIAVVLGLLFNYFQPNGLPLINKASQTDFTDLRYENPSVDSSKNMYADTSLKQGPNKIKAKKDTEHIDDDILPEYKFPDDSAMQNKESNLAERKVIEEDINLDLNNLTKDVFNQPRLISLSQAYELYRAKILFVDARDTELFEEGHISGAINLPYFYIDKYMNRLDGVDRMDPIVTYCEGADCDMAIRLGNELFAKGFRKVFVFFGGWEEWERSGYPVITSTSELKLN
jgi:rhodanese-related sulfurtransferase